MKADLNGCSPSVFTAPRQSLWSPLMMSLVRSPLPGVGWGVLKVLLSILISPWLSSQDCDYPLGRRLRGGPRSEGILGTGCRQGVALKVRKALPGIQGPELPLKTPFLLSQQTPHSLPLLCSASPLLPRLLLSLSPGLPFPLSLCLACSSRPFLPNPPQAVSTRLHQASALGNYSQPRIFHKIFCGC